jgi:hypothetical protein
MSERLCLIITFVCRTKAICPLSFLYSRLANTDCSQNAIFQNFYYFNRLCAMFIWFVGVVFDRTTMTTAPDSSLTRLMAPVGVILILTTKARKNNGIQACGRERK